jgi:hypothetical protein
MGPCASPGPLSVFSRMSRACGGKKGGRQSKSPTALRLAPLPPGCHIARPHIVFPSALVVQEKLAVLGIRIRHQRGGIY